ncbi:GyrI-like domain-containing protein [Nocardia sp. BSTN01]|uniref:GyrI-like domain-containing protein n=1 Tax=Nocardia sp. BSTN01 TaxID=2783665 RepID=UPI00188EA9D0|nr:GyrI-like domain-containing protein [Nocardia sp. BSTN01]MBF4998235.1 GyrI-like domain-containing protein [Nocardia sp. BSTN01]
MTAGIVEADTEKEDAMDYRVDVCEVPPQALLRLPRAIRTDRPGEDITAGMRELFATVARSGLTASGPTAITYTDTERSTVATSVDFRVPVEPAAELSLASGAEVLVTPGTTVARACHHGGYRDLGAAYRSLAEWVDRNAYRVVGPPTEVYLVGPDEVSDPRQLVTEIRLPVAPSPTIVTRVLSDFDTALNRTRNALRSNGFTILAEVDLNTARYDGRTRRLAHHTILEVCRRNLLVAELADDDRADMIVPHPVVVRERCETVVVEAVDPTIWARALDDEELLLLAADSRRHLIAAIDDLATTATAHDG